MNQTLLIVLGVTVFAMTVAGVLIYFYSLVARLAEGSDGALRDVVPLRAGNADS